MRTPVDVIGGIRLASRDCRAQKNDMAANELERHRATQHAGSRA